MRMNRRTSILSAVVAIAVTTLAMVTVAFAAQEQGGGQGQQKVTICHEGHTITVGAPALAAHERHGDTEGACATTGQDRPRLHPGAKITLKLLRLGESQSLAEVYASDHTGFKVKRAMRKGLMVFCRPGGYDTLTFTCEGATPPPLTTTPETTTPETTVPETTTPDTPVPDTTVPDTTVPVTTVPDTTVPATTP